MKLSTGHTVVLKKHYTHKAEREYNSVLMRGVTFVTEIIRDKDGNAMTDPKTGDIMEKTVPSGLSADNTTKANEKLIECLVDTVTDSEGRPVTFSYAWLEELPQEDYKTLEAAALAMKTAVDALKPKKDDEETARVSDSKKS